MKIYRIAKHVSSSSHFCGVCGSNLVPSGFSRNERHHFVWGIDYKCGCGYSSLWTNSIRGEQEFLDVVYNGVEVNNVGSERGFCNDLYCGVCHNSVRPLKNGLYIDNSMRPVAYFEGDFYVISDLPSYIKAYVGRVDFRPDENQQVSYSGIMGSYDVFGCVQVQHNVAIISRGYSDEYGEAEYSPIYDWIKDNKEKIPVEMIQEFKEYI